MAIVTFEVADDMVQRTSASSGDFVGGLRLAAAMHWYKEAEVTMATAAAVAGLDLRGILSELSRRHQNIFETDTLDAERRTIDERIPLKSNEPA